VQCELARDEVEEEAGGQGGREGSVGKVRRVEEGLEGHRLPPVRAVVAADRVADRLDGDVDADVPRAAANLELEHVSALAACEVEHARAAAHVARDEDRLDPVVQVAEREDV